MVELAKTITYQGKTFRAWKKGQFGYSTLVTIAIPQGSKSFVKENIVPIVMKQNGLVWKHTSPRFEPTSTGVVMLKMGISPDLVTGLQKLGGYAAMGARTVKFNLKKNIFEVKKKVMETSEKPPRN